MSTTVWKYPLDLVDEPQVIEVPDRAMLVHVADQYGELCVWFEVDPSRDLVDRWFTVEGTGHPVPDGATWMGTALMAGGQLVWHVYEHTHLMAATREGAHDG